MASAMALTSAGLTPAVASTGWQVPSAGEFRCGCDEHQSRRERATRWDFEKAVAES
jgi:hypothetical protein